MSIAGDGPIEGAIIGFSTNEVVSEKAEEYTVDASVNGGWTAIGGKWYESGGLPP